jgi:sugar lactone lactonase YvrE
MLVAGRVDLYSRCERAVVAEYRSGGESIVETIAGNGVTGFATELPKARFNTPTALALSADGNLFVADTNNNRIQGRSGEPPSKYHGGGASGGPPWMDREEERYSSTVRLALDSDRVLYVAELRPMIFAALISGNLRRSGGGRKLKTVRS